MTPEQIENLRALLALLVVSVAGCPMTDSDDKKQLMQLWYSFNQGALTEDHS